MDLRPYLHWIAPIDRATHVYEAMRRFQSGTDPRFIPVLEVDGSVAGILKDESLRSYMFALFGHELLKRHPLTEFLTPCTTIPITASHETALTVYSARPNPDGLVVLDHGRYAGVLPTESLLSLYEENRVRIRKQMLQSQKMEAIGTLAGGIAHDFNNILMPIQGYSEMLIRQSDPDCPSRMYAEQILKASKRARDLVQQILAFSRQKDQEAIVFSLKSVVDEVVKLLRVSVPPAINLRVIMKTSADSILADPTQMHQVLMNLCTNAAYAMRERNGVIEIQLEGHEGVVEGWSTSGRRMLTGHLCLSVRDEGLGIDPRHMERIFEPFFTTKPVGEGTGLGLAVVHGIVSNLGGHIGVASQLGQGTIFRLYLPLSHAPELTNVVKAPDSPRGGGQRLLLVDDEPEILDLLRIFLREYGYTVDICNNGTAALELLAHIEHSIDLVITDLTMPGLSGLGLAQELICRYPALRVVLLTGHNSKGPESLPANICRVVEKPVDLAELAGHIAQHLEPAIR